jgi:hypothetical protein
VYITEDGQIIINPKLDSDNVVDKGTMKELLSKFPFLAEGEAKQADNDTKTNKKKYAKLIGKVPSPLRDHMPEFYLEPLIKLIEKERESGASLVEMKVHEEEAPAEKKSMEKETFLAGTKKAMMKLGAVRIFRGKELNQI